jgi:glycine hydroxymethyltransferase
MEPGFVEYARQVVANARALAGALMERGYSIVSGGTDNHLMLVDLRNRGLTGKAAEASLGAAHITVNKNTVPGETQSPFVTSGIRIGTSAVTTRGMKEGEMLRIAELIDRVLSNPDDEATSRAAGREARLLAGGFPLYPTADEAAARL